MNKTIAILGLGKMGKGLARRLLKKKHIVIGYNRSPDDTRKMSKEGLKPVYSYKELIQTLSTPRIIWLMVPAGKAVDEVLKNILPLMNKGDIIIDGGNSFYQDSIKRYELCQKKKINFIDVGVSGGLSGEKEGYCLMIGGDKKSFQKISPIYQAISDGKSYAFFPGFGAGHFAKMVHNGIEYGMMQSIAEGFEILKNSKYKYNLLTVAKLYNQKSIISSRLINWLQEGLEKYGEKLSSISGSVAQGGEGAWTTQVAKERKIKTPAIQAAVKFRNDSQTNPSFTGKILSALRNQFGGHSIK